MQYRYEGKFIFCRYIDDIWIVFVDGCEKNGMRERMIRSVTSKGYGNSQNV